MGYLIHINISYRQLIHYTRTLQIRLFHTSTQEEEEKRNMGVWQSYKGRLEHLIKLFPVGHRRHTLQF